MVMSSFCGRLLVVSVVLSSSLMGQTSPSSPTQLEAFRVTASRVAASEVEGPQTIDRYDGDHIASTGAFSPGEFLSSLPPAEEGTRQLVLVDGRPTFLDIDSLPLGMIASIEISRDGSMPEYGAFTNGRVINIKLKPNYLGHELGLRMSGSFAGGGGDRTARISTSSNRGPLRAIVSFELRRSLPLAAVDRDFSRDPDHRTLGGRDLRLGWGSPAVVQARSGDLTGFANGVALVRPGTLATGAPTLADFVGGDPAIGPGADNQRRFNPAPYRTLSSPSDRAGLNLQFTWATSDRLELTFSGSHARTRGERVGPPPVSPASGDTLVPAALNPFGRDVEVGLVHVEFGGTRQQTESTNTNFGLGATGKLPADWRWQASLGHRLNDSAQRTTEIDDDKLAAALRDPDPARRFNPFADPAAGLVNARLYPLLSDVRFSDSSGEQSELNFSARGPLARLPAGPVTLRLGGGYSRGSRERVSNRRAGDAPTRSEVDSRNRSSSASVSLPVFGGQKVHPWARRLDLQLSGDEGAEAGGGREWSAETGLVWAPLRGLSFRARHSWSTETSSRQILAGTETLMDDALLDPRRGGEALTDVLAIIRSSVDAAPETGRGYSVGVTVEPSSLRGLRVSASWRGREREQLFQDDFDPQDIVNNEAALASRVLRGTASADDLLRGWPGRISAVDLTPGTTGESARHDAEFSLEYRLPHETFGTFRASASADRALGSRYDVLPGVPFLQERPGGSRRPKWSGDALLSWSRARMNASVRARHTGALAPASATDLGLAAHTVVDFNAGWRLRTKAGEGRRAKEWRVTLGIGNVFDEAPPWADTLNGFRGGSALGRTYSTSLSLEL